MSPAAQCDSDRVAFAAFLRGINVGGRRSIRMADLRRAFLAQGFTDVKTVLASGNVRFAAAETDSSRLRGTVEHFLEQEFGYAIPVLLRPVTAIQELIKTHPFKDVVSSPQTRLYVTFLPEHASPSKELLADLPANGYSIAHATASEICSVLTLSEEFGTLDFMALLEKHFGSHITTRTWNAITRLVDAK